MHHCPSALNHIALQIYCTHLFHTQTVQLALHSFKPYWVLYCYASEKVKIYCKCSQTTISKETALNWSTSPIDIVGQACYYLLLSATICHYLSLSACNLLSATPNCPNQLISAKSDRVHDRNGFSSGFLAPDWRRFQFQKVSEFQAVLMMLEGRSWVVWTK